MQKNVEWDIDVASVWRIGTKSDMCPNCALGMIQQIFAQLREEEESRSWKTQFHLLFTSHRSTRSSLNLIFFIFSIMNISCAAYYTVFATLSTLSRACVRQRFWRKTFSTEFARWEKLSTRRHSTPPAWGKGTLSSLSHCWRNGFTNSIIFFIIIVDFSIIEKVIVIQFLGFSHPTHHNSKCVDNARLLGKFSTVNWTHTSLSAHIYNHPFAASLRHDIITESEEKCLVWEIAHSARTRNILFVFRKVEKNLKSHSPPSSVITTCKCSRERKIKD